MLCVAERRRRQPQLRGHRGRAGGLLPEPEDGAAVRTHQLRTGHQQSGKVSLSSHDGYTSVSNLSKQFFFLLTHTCVTQPTRSRFNLWSRHARDSAGFHAL